MKYEELNLQYFIDYINKRFHLIDLTSKRSNHLLNSIDPNFQLLFLDHEHLLADLMDFEWFIYCNDGLILKYHDYNYQMINSKLPYLHKPYADLMEERRKR